LAGDEPFGLSEAEYFTPDDWAWLFLSMNRDYAKAFEAQGAGELLLYSIDRDGTWAGFDLRLVESVSHAIGIPVVATGGAGSLEDIRAAVKQAGASAVAIGSMAVFQGKDLGVLIKFPSRKDQDAIFEQD